jgi:uncharacterized protein YbjT (DUF2867 family)
MKIIITGSLGHISKPLTIELLQKGHEVTVISSNLQKQTAIEALGAKAAIGSLEDVDFLTAAFAGADAVYCMIPPNNYFNHALNLLDYYSIVAANYFKAIEVAKVKHVVYLSSVGAHLKQGSGIIIGHHAGEAIMNRLPDDVAITFMRPVGFYYNLLGFVNVIKNKGFIEANYGADEHLVWVSPIDIAAAVAEELINTVAGRKIRYVVSDELSGNETAAILGEGIGKPDLKWKLIPGEQWLGNLKAIGMNPAIAAGLVEMFESQHKGLLTEDYYLNKPASFGKVKMKDFASDFAQVYNS